MIKKKVDILVVGSGVGGLTSGLFLSKRGFQTLICEKNNFYGGTTAWSQGMIWIPNTHHAKNAGIKDNFENAKKYLKNELGNFYKEEFVDIFLKKGPVAIEELDRDTEVKFYLYDTPDYHSNEIGGVKTGRSLSPLPFDAKLLGKEFLNIRWPIPRMLVLGGMMVSTSEVATFLNPFSSIKKLFHVFKRILRYSIDRVTYPRGTELGNGNALVARCIHSLKKNNVELWKNSPIKELIFENNKVSGAVINKDGKDIVVESKHGVILATGGFANNKQLRDEICKGFEHSETLVDSSNTGDGINVAKKIGAQIDNDVASPGYWTPISLMKKKDENLVVPYGWFDRGRPGIIAVNNEGKRFVNESNSYHDIVFAMFNDSSKKNNFHFICDSGFIKKRGLGYLLPWPWTLNIKKYVDINYINSAKTIEELAKKISVNKENLVETIKKNNEYSKTGKDLEFNRGYSSFNHKLGDKTNINNPNLGPIIKPPFYSLKIEAATLGTATGLKTDENCRVYNSKGSPIEGLYAAGNDMTSMMRGFYPGGGITIGPAIAFSYQIAEYIKEIKNNG